MYSTHLRLMSQKEIIKLLADFLLAPILSWIHSLWILTHSDTIGVHFGVILKFLDLILVNGAIQ